MEYDTSTSMSTSTTININNPMNITLTAPSASASASADIDGILDFWYGAGDEWRGGLWFRGAARGEGSGQSPGDPELPSADARSATDRHIRASFGPLLDALVHPGARPLRLCGLGSASPWLGSARGRVALITLLDQLSRNMHRGSERMFAYDRIACGIALELASDGSAFHCLPCMHALFVCVCLTHSEELAHVNTASVELVGLISRLEKEASAEEQYSTATALTRPRIQSRGKLPLPPSAEVTVHSSRGLAGRLKNVLKQTEAHFKLIQR
jgi:uncharacterized protein (DUF924 family)